MTTNLPRFPAHYLDHAGRPVGNFAITEAGVMAEGSRLVQADVIGDQRLCIDIQHVESWRYEVGEGVLWVNFPDRQMRFTSADPADRYGPTNDLDEAIYTAKSETREIR